MIDDLRIRFARRLAILAYRIGGGSVLYHPKGLTLIGGLTATEGLVVGGLTIEPL